MVWRLWDAWMAMMSDDLWLGWLLDDLMATMLDFGSVSSWLVAM
jgi:hypothetical protein